MRSMLILGIGLCMAAVVTPVQADRCGASNRVPLPLCAHESYTHTDTAIKVKIRNHCSYRVTVKVDVRGGRDARFSVNPGQTKRKRLPRTIFGGSVRNVMCCPRYSQCAGT